MKTEEIILDNDQKDQLNELASEYLQVCADYTAIESKKKALGSVIKTMLDTFGIKKYVSDDNISLSMSVRQNVSFDEDLLLNECKSFDIDGLVKTKEYVDMEVLESALYHDGSLKENIKKCQIEKPDTVTLRCTQKKTLNE